MKTLVQPLLLAVAIVAGAQGAAAADKNKCGCYKDTSGICFCDKKAQCGCPGECEPKGCDEAREKQFQRELDAETKKAAQVDRMHRGASNSQKSSSRDKRSGGGKEDSPKPSRGSKSASAAESTSSSASSTRRLTPAQANQLVKLLDLYLAKNPGARIHSVQEVRNELSQSR
jgi:hypothetical protein